MINGVFEEIDFDPDSDFDPEGTANKRMH